ncbi:MAG: hypothetical protein AB7R55_20315 [Gemmatimonadales bacterium]
MPSERLGCDSMILRLAFLGVALSTGFAVGPALGQRPFAQVGGGVALFRTERGVPADSPSTEVQPLAMTALGVRVGALILRVDGRAHGARLGTLLAATAGLGVTTTAGSARPYLLGAVGRGKITEGDRGMVLSALVGLASRRLFAEARVDRLTADEPFRQRISTYLSLQAGVRLGR